ncbi:MAG: uracil-DNA glycosylase family protein [Planctomycetota bacterium]
MTLERIARDLRRDVEALAFAAPVAAVYDPLDYARRPHRLYLRRYGGGPKEVLLVGMNPGPFGMAQTGVPFGDVELVRTWLGIEAPVDRPSPEHPKRPVEGFLSTRREVSGRRLWSWAAERFATPDVFFTRFFVWNYCPLAFLEAGGRNRTPDKLPAAERALLFAACDRALRRVVRALEPRHVVGIGAFAERRAREALDGEDVAIGRVLHPSPASPRANRGWARQMDEGLRALGIDVPTTTAGPSSPGPCSRAPAPGRGRPSRRP